MMDVWITIGIAWIVVVVACFVLSEVGPERYRTRAKWAGVILATLGSGAALWLMDARKRRGDTSAPAVIHVGHGPSRDATDREVERIDERIEEVDREIARPPEPINDDDLGADMARRLDNE